MKKFHGGNSLMKKLFITLALIIVVSMAMISCKPHGSDLGPFLEITATGTYTNENTGKPTTEKETLKACVNIASDVFLNSKSDKKSRRNMHINGFIIKGPFGLDCDVKLRVLDKNYEELKTSTEIANALVKAGDVFQIDLSKIDVLDIFKEDISINLNAFTTAQANRLEVLMKDKVKYNKAYNDAKREILTGLGMEDFYTDELEFHQLDMAKNKPGDNNKIKDEDVNSLLVVASSMLAGTGGEGSFFKNFVEDITDNGKIDNETVKNLVKTRKEDTKDNIDKVKTYFSGYFDKSDAKLNKEFVGISKKVSDWLNK